MNLAFKLLVSKNKVQGYFFPKQAANSAKELFLTPRKYPVKSWEQEKEKQGTRHALENGLSALSWGQSHQKILLVHGWESRATQMSGFVELLLESGYQVIALDGPAHGRSTGEKANPLMFAEAVIQANSELGPFDGIVGHSMGGSAVAIALSEGVQCDKVVLISSPSSIDGVLKRFARFIGLPSNSEKQFIQMVGDNVGRPASALEIAELIKNTSSKGLVIHDKDDIEVPFEDAKSIVKSWQDAELISTQGYGHRAIIRQTEVWSAIVRFIDSTVVV